MTPAGFPHSDTPGSTLGCQLPRAYRRLLRPSSALDAKASTMCPSQLVTHTTNPTPTHTSATQNNRQTTDTGKGPDWRCTPNSQPTTAGHVTHHKEPRHAPHNQRHAPHTTKQTNSPPTPTIGPSIDPSTDDHGQRQAGCKMLASTIQISNNNPTPPPPPHRWPQEPGQLKPQTPAQHGPDGLIPQNPNSVSANSHTPSRAAGVEPCPSRARAVLEPGPSRARVPRWSVPSTSLRHHPGTRPLTSGTAPARGSVWVCAP